jgi:hypothetical protein
VKSETAARAAEVIVRRIFVGEPLRKERGRWGVGLENLSQEVGSDSEIKMAENCIQGRCVVLAVLFLRRIS